MFTVDAFDHVALRVRDLERSIAWYRDVLGLEREHIPAWGDYPVVLRAGGASLALFQAASPDLPSTPPEAIRVTHIAFRVGREAFARARGHLEALGLAPQFQDHELCHSLYVRDPDGYEVEITTYEV